MAEMDKKERQKLMMRIGAGLGIVLTMVFLVWYLFFMEEGEVQEKAPDLGPSESMLPTDPKSVQHTPGSIMIDPIMVQFTPDMPFPADKIIRITAKGAPVSLNKVLMPDTDSDTLTVQNIDCPSPPAMIPADGYCSASITYKGTRTVSSKIVFQISTTDDKGQPASLEQAIAVSGATNNPAPAGTDPNASGQNGAVPGENGSTGPAGPAGQKSQVDSLPDQAAQGGGSRNRSPFQQVQGSYVNGRRTVAAPGATPALQPVARNRYSSWDNIGVQGFGSSFPTDMARVITPDKPLTAVLSVAIDTRQPVTAVAMVDRDIYGNNGRSVIIPRGSKLIGTLSSASERVGIAWSQLIRPDGARFVFEGASGDASGRGGIPGKINERNLQRYGYSLLPNLASAAITVGLGGQNTSTIGTTGTTESMDAKAVAAQILSQPLNQIAQDIYRRKGQMPIQITVPAGTRITVWSTGDLRLKAVGERDINPKETSQPSSRNASASIFAGSNSNSNSGYSRSQSSYNGAGRNYDSASTEAGNGASNDDAGTEGVQVGTIDANGNYVPPSGTRSAPSPNPYATNTGSSNATGNTNKAPWQK